MVVLIEMHVRSVIPGKERVKKSGSRFGCRKCPVSSRGPSAHGQVPWESLDPWLRRVELLERSHGLLTMTGPCGGTMGPGFRREDDTMSRARTVLPGLSQAGF